MNDEGASHYQAIVDNMGLGYRLLNETFGSCGVPKVAWQVDPFGHSKEQAFLFQKMGLDGYFFGRLDYREKEDRLANQTMEMVWETSPDFPGADIFTGINYNVYWPPPGFCWDYYCNDDPIIDDPNSEDYNADLKARGFINYVNQQAANYKTNHILVTLGMDFHYSAAHTWFKNIDKLIYHVNALQQSEGSDINLFYSTPSCYLKSLNEAAETWPVMQYDFFPYADWHDHAYWTGYFTSR